MEASVWIQILTLVGIIAGFFYTWFREARTREWQQADAKELAGKLAADATAMALKVNTDAVAMAAKVNQDAATMAAKVIDDAEKIATKVHESAEKLANKVAENTVVSTSAAQKAESAFTEANTVNAKIANLQAQLLKIGEHIERTTIAAAAAEKAAHDEGMFNKRVKAAIEEKLEEMNGHAQKPKQKRIVK